MKSKIYEFDPVIYPFPIHITKEWDEDEMKKKYKALNASDEEVAFTDELSHTQDTTARVINVVDAESGKMYYLVVLFRPQDIGAGISAHEAVHLANAYLQYLGFSCPSAYNDEPYAYFVQWVTNCIYSVVSNVQDAIDAMKGKLIE